MADRPLETILDDLKDAMSDLASEIEAAWEEHHERFDALLKPIEKLLEKVKL